MPPGDAVHCLHTHGWPRLETGPRHEQNGTNCHTEKARPIRSEPEESQPAPWRLQSIANRPGAIRAAQRSPPNSSACHVQQSAENEQRAKPHQEHSRLSIHRCNTDTTGPRFKRREGVWFLSRYSAGSRIDASPCVASIQTMRGEGRHQKNPALTSSPSLPIHWWTALMADRRSLLPAATKPPSRRRKT